MESFAELGAVESIGNGQWNVLLALAVDTGLSVASYLLLFACFQFALQHFFSAPSVNGPLLVVRAP